MPGTARAMGLTNPFDAVAAIDAQAHLMRDLLRRFASVPLALAAYNAGPGAVAGCMCIPPYPETRGYVARILALLNGAGEPASRRRPHRPPRAMTRGTSTAHVRASEGEPIDGDNDDASRALPFTDAAVSAADLRATSWRASFGIGYSLNERCRR